MSHVLPELRTERLLLRAFRDEDLAPFAAINADPRVMEQMPGLLSREESDAMVGRIRAHVARTGFGLWAVEVVGHGEEQGREPGRFIGFAGLATVPFEAHFTPAVESGWRLGLDDRRLGYATEAARAALGFAFERLALREVVSFTTTTNVRSRRVMEKLGLTHDERDDFDHPRLPEGHPLRRHVLYRIAGP